MWTIGVISLARSQWLAIVCGIGTLLIVFVVMRLSRFGLLLRALADDSSSLERAGYNIRLLRLGIFALAGMIAGVASLLSAFGQGFDATSGISLLLPGIVAVILGGRSFVIGPAVAGMILGIVRSAVSWYASPPWQDPITFAILLVVLLFRPQHNRIQRFEEGRL